MNNRIEIAKEFAKNKIEIAHKFIKESEKFFNTTYTKFYKESLK